MMSADNAQPPGSGRKTSSAIEILLSRDPEPPGPFVTTETTSSRAVLNPPKVPASSSQTNLPREVESVAPAFADTTTQNASPLTPRQSLPSMAQLTESLGHSSSAPPSYGLAGPPATGARPALVEFEKTRKRTYDSKPNFILRHRNAEMPQTDPPIHGSSTTHDIIPGRSSPVQSDTTYDQSRHHALYRDDQFENARASETRQSVPPLIQSTADLPAASRLPVIHLTVDMAAYRRDMERVEDWASRLYHFATSAGNLSGLNQAVDTNIELPDGQKIPDAAQFELALQQCRGIAGVLQMYVNQYAPLANVSRPPPRIHTSGSTSSAGEYTSGVTPPASHDQASTFVSGGESSWDYADEQAMKYRKRSAPKRLFGIGGAATGPVPIVPAAPTAAQNMHVARQALPGRCHSCNIAETPEWRRGPDGARTLCNACGLHFAKLTKRKQQSIQGRGEAA